MLIISMAVKKSTHPLDMHVSTKAGLLILAVLVLVYAVSYIMMSS